MIVGNRVQIINRRSYYYNQIGIIDNISGENCTVTMQDGDTLFFFQNELELV